MNNCSCTVYKVGSVGRVLCPKHAYQDPCATVSQVTGKRRKGSIKNGVCSNCTWSGMEVEK